VVPNDENQTTISYSTEHRDAVCYVILKLTMMSFINLPLSEPQEASNLETGKG